MKEERIKCPNCSNQILAGAKKCRFCGEWFTEENIPAENSSPTATQAPELKQELSAKPEEERTKCPHCSEQILADAKKCRFCGEWFTEENIPSVNSSSTNAQAPELKHKLQAKSEEERTRCPHCSEQILADSKKCRFCGEWFTEENIPSVNSSSTNAQAPKLKQELSAKPEEERTKCPHCSEQILADAKKCRFCGEWFEEKYKHSVNSDRRTSEKVIFGDRNVPVETKGFGLEEYERLKNNILSLGSEKAIKTIVVSSSVAGEGCSTVAAHLAISLAKNSVFKVLLIDGNLRHPTLHKSFGLKNNMGLSDLILSKAGINDVLKKTDFPNLLVMPSGKNNKIDPPQIFESQKLKTLIGKLKDECNYLVFDSPPVSTYPDSTILASQMDGVVLVVHAEKTRFEVAQRVKEQLEMANTNILGVLLNKKNYVIPKFIYNRMK